ncbi:carbonic anhydrase [Vibrio sp. 10N]|uniref:carbonic anhydrase n=1 Tax=Vibrio sp. 10N TaxID=3058938 RepID=UPI002812A80D|nr:carbonic anhydrase [Vibrio sp. 10N]
MKKLTALSFAVCATLSFTSPVNAEAWGYGEGNGPNTWGKVSATCDQGQNQSPVDIETNKLTSANKQPLAFDYQGEVKNIVNNGHTIQVNVTGKNTLSIDDQDFELKQFHFHTPSENTINGKAAPLEAHFVHANQQGQLAVVAVMYKRGERESAQLENIVHTLPAKAQTITPEKTVQLNELLPRVKDYYRYNGSLTTPPCSEGVRWLVLRDPQFIPQQQLKRLSKTMGDNARPTQALNARLILN